MVILKYTYIKQLHSWWCERNYFWSELINQNVVWCRLIVWTILIFLCGRKYLRETLKIANSEDLNRLTACSLVLLGNTFLSQGITQVWGHMFWSIIFIQSDKFSWVKRQTYHELNLLHFVHLMWSSMFDLGLRGTTMSMCILVKTRKSDKLKTYYYGFLLKHPWLFVNCALHILYYC